MVEGVHIDTELLLFLLFGHLGPDSQIMEASTGGGAGGGREGGAGGSVPMGCVILSPRVHILYSLVLRLPTNPAMGTPNE